MDDERATPPATVGELRRRLERLGWPWTVPDRFNDDDPLPQPPRGGQPVEPGHVEGLRAVNTQEEFEACLREIEPINPLLAERAVEAGMIFGLSNAMSERITLAGGAPEQTNFDTYQVLRIDQAPDVTVEIISVGDEPGSFGEIGTMPVGTALGNAIFSATGKRIRTQPFGANGVTFV